jgi:hypothetical protein
LIKALSDKSPSADTEIEAAIGSVTECVYEKTVGHAAAREKYPKLFEPSKPS